MCKYVKNAGKEQDLKHGHIIILYIASQQYKTTSILENY